MPPEPERIADDRAGRQPSQGGACLAIRCAAVAVCCLAGVTLLAGCRQKMVDQPRYEPYEASHFFPDSLSARPVVEGTVARGRWPRRPLARPRGRVTDSVVTAPAGTGLAQTNVFPFTVTRTVLARGRQQFDVYCAPCHGRAGDGQGMIVQRGLRPPPSFHTERLRRAPAGHFVDVMTNGYGAMYSYAARVAPADRWAIAAYIRALQLSRHATLADVPAGRRRALAAQDTNATREARR